MFGTKRLKSKSHTTYPPARATDSLLKHRLPLPLLPPLPPLPHPLPLPPAPPTPHLRKPNRHPPTPPPPLRLANFPHVSQTNLSIKPITSLSIYQCNPIIKDKHGTAIPSSKTNTEPHSHHQRQTKNRKAIPLTAETAVQHHQTT